MSETYRVTVDADGSIRWRQNNKLHRLDGPAVEYRDGREEWLYEGKYHRTGGPAIINANGTKEYWIYGTKLCKEDFDLQITKSCDGKVVEIDGVKYTLKKLE